jgi:hypothetical protein
MALVLFFSRFLILTEEEDKTGRLEERGDFFNLVWSLNLLQVWEGGISVRDPKIVPF